MNPDPLDRAFYKPNFRKVQKHLYDKRDIKVKGTPEGTRFAADETQGGPWTGAARRIGRSGA
jgi:hypothetical protein